jgi:hypothetical protein
MAWSSCWMLAWMAPPPRHRPGWRWRISTALTGSGSATRTSSTCGVPSASPGVRAPRSSAPTRRCASWPSRACPSISDGGGWWRAGAAVRDGQRLRLAERTLVHLEPGPLLAAGPGLSRRLGAEPPGAAGTPGDAAGAAGQPGEELRAYRRASKQGDRADGGDRGDGDALLYRFERPQGSLLYQDACGYWTGLLCGLHADVALLAAAGVATSMGNRSRARSQRSSLARWRCSNPCD